MTEQQRPTLHSVTRDGDDIVLRGFTPNAAFFSRQRINHDDFDQFVHDGMSVLGLWTAMERVYQELVAGTLYSDEEDVEASE